MLLFGGYNYQSNEFETGIWMLKDDNWSRIGELLQVWKENLTKIILYFREPGLEMQFTSADRCIIFNTGSHKRFIDWTWAKQKNSKKWKKLENSTFFLILLFSKLIMIIVFEIICAFSIYFLFFSDFLISKNKFFPFCQIIPIFDFWCESSLRAFSYATLSHFLTKIKLIYHKRSIRVI